MTNLLADPQPREVVVAKETRFLEQGLIHRTERGDLRHTTEALIGLNRVTSGFRQTDGLSVYTGYTGAARFHARLAKKFSADVWCLSRRLSLESTVGGFLPPQPLHDAICYAGLQSGALMAIRRRR
jgi:hypothetical protein